MTTKQFIPLEQFAFIVAPPESRTQSMYTTIYADGRLNLNGKLAEKLRGKHLQIRFTDDAKHLCFIEITSEDAIKFPQNGSKRLPSVIDFLKKHKVRLPARYAICYCEEFGFWQGDFCENPTQSQTRKQSNTKKK